MNHRHRLRNATDLSRAAVLEERHGTRERNDAIARRAVHGESLKSLAAEFGLTKGRVGQIVRNRGVASRKNKRREEHPQWGGGRCKSGCGYVRVYMPEHHLANAKGWVLEHVYVAEEHYGRRVQPHEVVHHRNEIRDDNRPENLEIMGRAEHSSYHRKLTLKRQKEAVYGDE